MPRRPPARGLPLRHRLRRQEGGGPRRLSARRVLDARLPRVTSRGRSRSRRRLPTLLLFAAGLGRWPVGCGRAAPRWNPLADRSRRLRRDLLRHARLERPQHRLPPPAAGHRGAGDRRGRPRRRPASRPRAVARVTVAVGAALAWLVAGTLLAAPHWIGYFNEAAGGWRKGHRYLADSNLDWGQDLLRLRARLARESERLAGLARAGRRSTAAAGSGRALALGRRRAMLPTRRRSPAGSTSSARPTCSGSTSRWRAPRAGVTARLHAALRADGRAAAAISHPSAAFRRPSRHRRLRGPPAAAAALAPGAADAGRAHRHLAVPLPPERRGGRTRDDSLTASTIRASPRARRRLGRLVRHRSAAALSSLAATSLGLPAGARQRLRLGRRRQPHRGARPLGPRPRRASPGLSRRRSSATTSRSPGSSYQLDAQLSGATPRGVHATNLVLHLLASALVGALAWWFAPPPLSVIGAGAAAWPCARPRACCALRLFALHPIHVETVAWATERRDLLSTVLVLAAVLLHLTTSPGDSAPSRSRWAVALLHALAALSRAQMSLPFVLLALDLWPLGRLGGGPDGARSFRQLLAEKSLSFAVAGASAVAALWAQASSGALTAASEHGLAGAPRAGRLQPRLLPGRAGLSTALAAPLRAPVSVRRLGSRLSGSGARGLDRGRRGGDADRREKPRPSAVGCRDRFRDVRPARPAGLGSRAVRNPAGRRALRLSLDRAARAARRSRHGEAPPRQLPPAGEARRRPRPCRAAGRGGRRYAPPDGGMAERRDPLAACARPRGLRSRGQQPGAVALRPRRVRRSAPPSRALPGAPAALLQALAGDRRDPRGPLAGAGAAGSPGWRRPSSVRPPSSRDRRWRPTPPASPG